MGTSWRFIPLSIFVLAMPGSLPAAIHCVSTTGSNANDGTVASAWRDIGYALCGGDYGCPCTTANVHRVASGDTLYLRGGTYHENQLALTNAGTSTSPIVITSFPSEMATIDADLAGDNFNIGVYGHGTSYVVFDNLRIIHGMRSGIRIGENYTGDNITIRNCRFENHAQNDNSAAVLLVGGYRNVTVRNCVILGDGTANLNYCGVQIFGGDGSVRILNCDISNVSTGIFYKHRSQGIMETVIRNNFVHDNKTKGIWISSDRVTVQNNLVVNNVGAGIDFWEDAGGTGGSYSSAQHNTVYNHAYSMIINWGGQLGPTGDHGATHDTLVSNISYGNNSEEGAFCIWPYVSAGIDSVHNTISDFNCYYLAPGSLYPTNVMREFEPTYTLAEWRAKYPSRDVHSVQGQPSFANASGTLTTIQDFRLLSGNGYRAASDGTDMGARIDSVGPQGSAATGVNGSMPRDRSGCSRGTGPSHMGALSHCATIAASCRSTAGPRKAVFDIRGRQLRRDQVQAAGIVISVGR